MRPRRLQPLRQRTGSGTSRTGCRTGDAYAANVRATCNRQGDWSPSCYPYRPVRFRLGIARMINIARHLAKNATTGRRSLCGHEHPRS
jgi:hypothetical protein